GRLLGARAGADQQGEGQGEQARHPRSITGLLHELLDRGQGRAGRELEHHVDVVELRESEGMDVAAHPAQRSREPAANVIVDEQRDTAAADRSCELMATGGAQPDAPAEPKHQRARGGTKLIEEPPPLMLGGQLPGDLSKGGLASLDPYEAATF